MATKNIVPRATGEGGLGTSSKLWKEVHHVTASFGGVSLISGSSNLQVSGGPLVAASGLSGSLTQLSSGASYIIAGSNMTVTSASNGSVTLASTDTDTTYTAGSGLALTGSSNTEFTARSSVAVTVAGGKFVIDGSSQQTLSLAKGVVYYFDQSDSSNAGSGGHPLRFSETENGAGGELSSNYYTKVVSAASPGTTGAFIQIQLQQDAPSVLYYYCSSHSGMGGKIETAPDALLTGNKTFANDLTVAGSLIVQGTTTTVSSSNTTLQDPIIGLGVTGSETFTNTGDRGIIFARGASSDAALPGLWWDGTQFNLAKSLTSPASSSFGTVTSYSPIKAGAITAAGNLIPSAVDTYNLGSTSAEWANLYLGDSSYIYFGNDQDVNLSHVPDTGLKLELGTAGEGEPILEIASSADQASGPSLKLNMQKTADVNDVIGNIEYLSDNATGDDKVYGSITTSISNVGVDGIFTGDMKFNVVSSGSLHTALLISGSDLRQTGSVDIPGHNATDSGLMLGGTLVKATAAELNLLDGGTSVGGSITIDDADGVIVNDAGTMKTIPASDLKSYIGAGAADDITAGDGAVTITTTSGNTLINSANAGTTTISGSHVALISENDVTVTGDLVPAAANAQDLGTSAKEWRDLYLGDDANIYFGNAQDYYLDMSPNTSTLSLYKSGSNGTPVFRLINVNDSTIGPQITLFHDSLSPATNDTLGKLSYFGRDSASAMNEYSRVSGRIINTTNGSERGAIDINVMSKGSLASAIKVEGGNDSSKSTVDIVDHNATDAGLELAGTLVTATAAELNLLDGGTSVGVSISIDDADGFVINDGGTMKTIPASDVKSYAGGGGGGGGGGKFGLAVTTGSNFTTTAFASAEERQLYIVDSSNAVTATLAVPAATTHDGYEVNIKRFGAGAVHITGSAGVLAIDGSTTFDLPSQYSSVTLIATGSQFVIV